MDNAGHSSEDSTKLYFCTVSKKSNENSVTEEKSKSDRCVTSESVKNNEKVKEKTISKV